MHTSTSELFLLWNLIIFCLTCAFLLDASLKISNTCMITIYLLLVIFSILKILLIILFKISMQMDIIHFLDVILATLKWILVHYFISSFYISIVIHTLRYDILLNNAIMQIIFIINVMYIEKMNDNKNIKKKGHPSGHGPRVRLLNFQDRVIGSTHDSRPFSACSSSSK